MAGDTASSIASSKKAFEALNWFTKRTIRVVFLLTWRRLFRNSDDYSDRITVGQEKA